MYYFCTSLPQCAPWLLVSVVERSRLLLASYIAVWSDNNRLAPLSGHSLIWLFYIIVCIFSCEHLRLFLTFCPFVGLRHTS